MSRLAIMSRDLTGYFMSPDILVTRRVYESDKGYHLAPGSYMYGAVLVEMQDKPDGLSVTLEFRPSGFSWRPRACKHQRRASWLGFRVAWERKFQEVPGRVVADHLAQHRAAEAMAAHVLKQDNKENK